MDAKISYLKNKDGEIISPIIAMDSVYDGSKSLKKYIEEQDTPMTSQELQAIFTEIGW